MPTLSVFSVTRYENAHVPTSPITPIDISSAETRSSTKVIPRRVRRLLIRIITAFSSHVVSRAGDNVKNETEPMSVPYFFHKWGVQGTTHSYQPVWLRGVTYGKAAKSGNNTRNRKLPSRRQPKGVFGSECEVQDGDVVDEAV